ncbi:hypothetical protein [Megamonas hypermegale]|uniref:hypothetical protein n=1 Tax=Megamonas hypermegale TaxID=158847 RepID=UPI0026EA0C87|nr:hypothetical protein [Megamonas hypermegale]
MMVKNRKTYISNPKCLEQAILELLEDEKRTESVEAIKAMIAELEAEIQASKGIDKTY